LVHGKKLNLRKTVAAQRARSPQSRRRVQWRALGGFARACAELSGRGLKVDYRAVRNAGKHQHRSEPERLVFIETFIETGARTVMDNLGSHNVVRQLIRIADARLFSLVQMLGGVESDRADFRQGQALAA
jgi:hypothetical protein